MSSSFPLSLCPAVFVLLFCKTLCNVIFEKGPINKVIIFIILFLCASFYLFSVASSSFVFFSFFSPKAINVTIINYNMSSFLFLPSLSFHMSSTSPFSSVSAPSLLSALSSVSNPLVLSVNDVHLGDDHLLPALCLLGSEQVCRPYLRTATCSITSPEEMQSWINLRFFTPQSPKTKGHSQFTSADKNSTALFPFICCPPTLHPPSWTAETCC